ncbi:hypothetical protein ACFOGI_16690 [Virgibacillus xinjiangensis]|uniref:Antigen I/II N-terminal domain-containing protein n=1 Tax=Virgibacillus xinjiangensis TaxID=393090 RepID=A0ABV7D0C8_9BACI
MKKLVLILLLFMSALAACGSEEPGDAENTSSNDQDTDSDSSANSNTEDESVEVDEGLLNVEITFPASFFESSDSVADMDQLIADAKEMGIDEVVEHDDGSLTYKMSKRKHRELMEEYKTEITASMDEMADSEDLPSIQEITSNGNFSEFTMVVDQEAFDNSFDGFAAVSLGFSGMFYQLLDGVNPENYEVTVNIENGETGEITDTIVYPDAFEQTDES